MAAKTPNQKAWRFVLPVVLLVALHALIPLMTVVNYSVQETFGDNLFFWAGVGWFAEVLHSPRFHAARGRQLIFTAIILLIEVPLGVAIALSMPRKGPWVSVCLGRCACLVAPQEEAKASASHRRRTSSSCHQDISALHWLGPPFHFLPFLFFYK